MHEKYLKELGDDYEKNKKTKKVQKYVMISKIKLLQR